MTDEQTFINAYIECLLWSSEPDSSDEDAWPDDATLSDEARERCEVECKAFLYRFRPFIEAEPTDPGLSQAGHDFALTRNGHGAGFWDGDWPTYGDMLTKGSKSFGEIDIYVGDDGQLEIG